MIRISIPYPPYNAKRYGKPWGAIVSFDGARPVYAFMGHWDGEAVVIDVQPGQVIAHGQKDRRRLGPPRIHRRFYIAQNDGSLIEVSEKLARQHLTGDQPALFGCTVSR